VEVAGDINPDRASVCVVVVVGGGGVGGDNSGVAYVRRKQAGKKKKEKKKKSLPMSDANYFAWGLLNTTDGCHVKTMRELGRPGPWVDAYKVVDKYFLLFLCHL
jgi:hypothetical protein